ncbi:MAG: hypothetical protein WBM84_14335 [Sedimenticolaceae bacterium]
MAIDHGILPPRDLSVAIYQLRKLDRHQFSLLVKAGLVARLLGIFDQHQYGQSTRHPPELIKGGPQLNVILPQKVAIDRPDPLLEILPHADEVMQVIGPGFFRDSPLRVDL